MAQGGPVARACATYAGMHTDMDLSFHVLPPGLETDQYQAAKVIMDTPKGGPTMRASFFVTNDKVGSLSGDMRLAVVRRTTCTCHQHSTA